MASIDSNRPMSVGNGKTLADHIKSEMGGGMSGTR